MGVRSGGTCCVPNAFPGCDADLMNTCVHHRIYTISRGALSAVRAQCGHSAIIWASSRTRDPYFVTLGASLLPLP